MTVIAKDVFTTAMLLMDEETQDGTYEGYPTEYKSKSWPILTMLQTELLPVSILPSIVTSEASELQLDDRVSLSVLPYGLAAHLLLSEDQSRAAFYNARYDELKRKMSTFENTSIEMVYTIDVIPTEEV